METAKFESMFERFTKSPKINEAVLLIETTNGNFSYQNEYGGKSIDTPFLMASITKLCTTACILQLIEQGKISLEDKLAKFFIPGLLTGIHVYRGIDYSMELTIANLLFQTSGLPDVNVDAKDSPLRRAIHEDLFVSFDWMMDCVKRMPSRFVPGTGKAYYADINFDLLGKILEMMHNDSLAPIYKKNLFDRLGLQETFLVERETDSIPTTYYKSECISRPKLIASCGASGGCVSTARELMVFIKAFFGGSLFDSKYFKTLAVYHKLQMSMGPLYYGGGYMKIPMDGIFTMFMGRGELLGHSGSTGSFAFYYPEREVFFVGDVAQMADASLPITLSMQLAMTASKMK